MHHWPDQKISPRFARRCRPGLQIDACLRSPFAFEFGVHETQRRAGKQWVRVVLASADFSKEITSAVLWLNAQGLDIMCFRMRPYAFQGRVLLDVQQVIPLPEAAAFQVAIREKNLVKAAVEAGGKDFTRYTTRNLPGFALALNVAYGLQ